LEIRCFLALLEVTTQASTSSAKRYRVFQFIICMGALWALKSVGYEPIYRVFGLIYGAFAGASYLQEAAG
jgi:hypothetical protein